MEMHKIDPLSDIGGWPLAFKVGIQSNATETEGGSLEVVLKLNQTVLRVHLEDGIKSTSH